jgi:hypothetical protein
MDETGEEERDECSGRAADAVGGDRASIYMLQQEVVDRLVPLK